MVVFLLFLNLILALVKKLTIIFIILLVWSCNEHDNKSSLLSDIELEAITGQSEFGSTSYITAGDRVYAIGAQNGTFPEIGWHIDKEMGGIWNHPIKLMDGFKLSLKTNSKTSDLGEAVFTNYPLGNSFQFDVSDIGLSIERFQFSPDKRQGLIIEYKIQNNEASGYEGILSFEAAIDLMPTWLGKRSNMVDGIDELMFVKDLNSVLAKDQNNDWYCVISSSESVEEYEIRDNQYKGKGKSAIMKLPVHIEANQSKIVRFYIAGSYKSKEEVISELDEIKSNSMSLLKRKVGRINQIDKQSRLTTSDPKFDEVYRWLKYNSEWFIRDVPEVGRGIAAGYPDYPWWFGCDSEYALQGYMSIGQFSIVKSTINLLGKLSREANNNGRIIHEASTNGVVFNPGNINETPQFATLIWQTYLWTGDRQVLEDNFNLIQKGLQWIASEMDIDQNGFPEGAGMMEVHGLDSEMIDVASYTQKGFEDAAKIAKELGENGIAKEHALKASLLKEKINDNFWVEDFESYGDFIASDEQTLQLIEDAIVRADTLNKPWAVEELVETKQYILDNPSQTVRPFVLHHNWVVNTPLEMKIADSEKAEKALKTARKFVNPYGVFVTGIDRDEYAGKELGSFKGSKAFSYTGAVMTLPTGVSAIAENNYGNPDQALDYLKRMGRSFSFALPGSIYEVSPDYGMFAQAWNLYSYAVPVVQQFFGIEPVASERKININPLMPSSWDFAKLENVLVGDNQISIDYKKTSAGYELIVKSEENGWDLVVETRKGYTILTKEVLDEKTSKYIVEKESEK
jgi:glycogen debranching enzyme